MANKRQLKKNISRVCGDLAADLILASYSVGGIDRDKVDNILVQIASLQSESRAKVSFVFDKVAKDFATVKEYKAARQAYNRAAFDRLSKDFAETATAIVKEMNTLIPAEARQAVSK